MKDFSQADYNDAIGYLNRINICFWNANTAASELRAVDWYYALRNLYRELSGYITDKKIFEDKFLIIDKIVFTAKKGMMSFELYTKLEELEILLRGIYKKSGLMMKEKQIPSLME